MIQDFKDIPVQEIVSMKGGTGTARLRAASSLPDGIERVMRVTLVKGASLGFHEHVTNTEIMYCLSGEGVMRESDGDHPFTPGMVDITGQGASHAIRNDRDEPLELFAVILKTC